MHLSDYDFSEDFPQSPEVRPPDESKRMCLYNDDDDQEDDSLHFADLVNHPFMSASLRRNYGENFHLPHHQHRPRDDPVPSSTLDPEVIEEMRKAGVPENQIQELIDFHMAEQFVLLSPFSFAFISSLSLPPLFVSLSAVASLDQEIANQRHYEEERGHFPVRYRDLDEQLSRSVPLPLSPSFSLTHTHISSHRVSGSIAELENRLSHRGGLGRGSGGERRGVPPYGVGIGSSTRTRPNRIGLRDSEDTALLSSRQVSSTSALQRLMDDDLAEFEERQLMDAIRESEELAQREKATAAATEASDSSDEGNSDERQRQQQRESEAEAEAAAVGNSFDVLHESSSSNSEATSPSGSGVGGGGGDVFENEEYDPLLELALKASLEEQKKEEEKRRMEEKKKSEEKKRMRKESPKERVRDRGSMSAAPASATATSSGSSSSNSKTPMGSAQSIPNLDFVVSHERKPSFRTEEQRVSQSHVESLSSLSRGPMPSRQAPSTPRSASSRSSSSPRSSIRSSPRNKESPGTSARGGGGGEARWNNSTKPSPRGGISRVSVDRTVSRAPAAAPYVPPRRSSQHSSTALSVAENEMLDRAIALSLADSVEAEATHASRPRASSGLRGGIRDRERDWERERERTWDRDRGTSRSFGTPLDLSDPYAASSSTFDRGGSRLPVQQQQLYYDDEEELARAIAESKRQS
jgi:hypothetical protein